MIPESNFELVRELTLNRITEMLVILKHRMRDYRQAPFLPLCKQFRVTDPDASSDRECRFCPLHDRGVRDCCTEMARLIAATKTGGFAPFLLSANRLYHRVSRLAYREYVRRFNSHQPFEVLHDGAMMEVCRTGQRRRLMPGEWGLSLKRNPRLYTNTGNGETSRPYDLVHLVFREEKAARKAG